MKYWALDYVDGYSCELVYNDQLYASWEDALDARKATGRPDLFDVTEYRYIDLLEVFGVSQLEIDDKLRVCY